MKISAAVEGLAKTIIAKLYQVFTDERLDDTEYVRNVRAIIESIDTFVKENSEVDTDPQILRQVLYSFSKELWISRLKEKSGQEENSDPESENFDADYHDYYYDYIYAHNAYPR